MIKPNPLLSASWNTFKVACAVPALIAATLALPAQAKTSGLYPVVNYRDVPSPIQELFAKNEPDLGPVGSCATAFDSQTDDDKMVFTCSIYIKILAEGERRGIKRCQELKEAKGIKAPCRIISR
jgi:hypothetical protein